MPLVYQPRGLGKLWFNPHSSRSIPLGAKRKRVMADFHGRFAAWLQPRSFESSAGLKLGKDHAHAADDVVGGGFLSCEREELDGESHRVGAQDEVAVVELHVADQQ